MKKVVFLRFFRYLGKYKLRGLEKFWVFWVFRKNKLRDLEVFWVFWCISSPGTYLERCAVKFWPSLPPRLLILKTKTFPLCKNNENLEFRSQCHILVLGRASNSGGPRIRFAETGSWRTSNSGSTVCGTWAVCDLRLLLFYIETHGWGAKALRFRKTIMEALFSKRRHLSQQI